MWREGKRQGWGTSFYDGKFGYDKWVGPFEDDKPHGNGIMHVRDTKESPNGGLNEEKAVPFAFERGDLVKEPLSAR